MRKLLLWVLILGVLAIPGVRAVAQEDSEAAKIRALETNLTDAYKHRQFDLLASLLDDDFVITFEDGNTYGKTGYISFSAKSSIRIDMAEMSDMKIRVHGNTGIVTGVYHERGEDKGQPYDFHDRFTDVWMKVAGRWVLIASHYAVPTKQ